MRIGRGGLAGCVKQVQVPQLELTAFDQRRRLFHRCSNAFPCGCLLRQQIGLQRGIILPGYRIRQTAGNRRQRIAVQRPQFSLRGAAHRMAFQRR